MNKYPLDQEGVLNAVSSLLEHNRAQEDLIKQLAFFLREAVGYIGDDNLSLCKKADELVESIYKRKTDFANLRFDQKNGHKTDQLSPYAQEGEGTTVYSPINPAARAGAWAPPNSNMPIEQEVMLSNVEEESGRAWTEEELAEHFGEPPPKKKKLEKEVSSMSSEEIKEWESKQENSNDIYKLSARIKNLARQGGLASLTPVGESLCNVYTHVLKAFYDFAESLPDKEVKIKLVELTRKHETMPGDFISAMHANVKS